MIRKGIFLVVLLAIVLFGMEAQAKSKIILEDTKIQGKIIRPEMSLILQRSKINYDALKLNESFLQRIVRSVQQEPF